MKAQIIQIGNSQGIRIPKMMLQDTGISGEVDLEVTSDGILIRNIKKPRGDWDLLFKAVGDTDDDQNLEGVSATSFEQREWQW